MQLIAIDPAKYYTSGDSGTIGSHKIRQTRVQKDIVYQNWSGVWYTILEDMMAEKAVTGSTEFPYSLLTFLEESIKCHELYIDKIAVS
jgi:rhamnogalacturonyl hydrolase YesR